jgi:hypothetical protein
MTLDCKLALASKNNFKAMCDLLESLVPMHISTSYSILYNQWVKYKDKTWADMSTTTWKSAKENI